MPALIKRSYTYRGVVVYTSARTRYNSRILNLLIFTEDIPHYIGAAKIKRFRYERLNPADFTRASAAASAFINMWTDPKLNADE